MTQPDYTDIRRALTGLRLNPGSDHYAVPKWRIDLIADNAEALLADAERWRMIEAPSKATIEQLARRIYEADRREKMGCRRTEDFWINVWDAEPDGGLQLLAYRHAEIALAALRNLTPDTP